MWPCRLGPREMIGVVWETRPLTPTNMKLREVIGKFDMVPMAELNRRFVDWVSAYYLEPPGNVLRMCLRAPAALEGERQQIAYVATGDEPQRMTPQRRRALDAAKDAPALRAGELAELAGVGLSVVKGLIGEGALKPVTLPAMRAFPGAAALGTAAQAFGRAGDRGARTSGAGRATRRQASPCSMA